MGVHIFSVILLVFSCIPLAHADTLYESPITVFDPGWLFFSPNRQITTFIRITTKQELADGNIELEAFVGDGAPKGVYKGVGKKYLDGAALRVELSRVKDPIKIDGWLTQVGDQYGDPFLGEPAPKKADRALSGMLTVRDGDKHTITNVILAVAREPNAAITRALDGLSIPESAVFGSYLNAVLVLFRGPDVGKHYAKLSSLVKEAYSSVQKDNAEISYHPTRHPIFATRDEVALLAIDFSSDVTALASRAMRANSFFAKTGALGVQQTYIIPVYKVDEGKIEYTLPGRKTMSESFEGFGGMIQSLFIATSEIEQEQKILFEKFGLRDVSNLIDDLRKDTTSFLAAVNPKLVTEPDIRQALEQQKKELVLKRKALLDRLDALFETGDSAGFLTEYSIYLEAIREALALGWQWAGDTNGVEKEFTKNSQLSIEKASKLDEAMRAKRREITLCFMFPQMVTMRMKLEMDYVNPKGRQNSWTWKWGRAMPKDLTEFYSRKR